MNSDPSPGCRHAADRPVAGEAVRGHYSRMFSASARPADGDYEQRLVELGSSMRYSIEREGTLTPRIGYTYLGQFIGHDISHDGTPLDGPYAEPATTANYRTPWLDLDHLYGGGPAESPHIYTGEAGAETFRIGLTSGGYARDLPLEDGAFLIADQSDARNLDNLILRQLQVVFLKFHNAAVQQLSTPGNPLREAADLQSETIFAAAQRLVRWHYQWIVRHDFLPRILQPAFWQRQRSSKPETTPSAAIPIEFSLAAFRYGHSIVRRTYPLNCQRKLVSIVDLLREGPRAAPLPDESLLEWGRYFDGLPRSGPPAASSFIDTAVVEPLHAMLPETVRLCSRSGNATESARLAERTLLRGARSKLASGQQVAAALVRSGAIEWSDVLDATELTRNTSDPSGSTLRKLGLEHETPLFYYVLKEAELRAEGLSLGPVGSHIVGTVLIGLLNADPHGYVTGAGNAWKLPRWQFPSGSREPVNSIAAVIRLIGDGGLLPACARKAAMLMPEDYRQMVMNTSAVERATA